MLLNWCWFLQRYEKTDWSCMQLVPHSSTSPQYVQRGESRSQKNVFLSHMVTGISLAGSVTQLWKSLHPWSRRDIKRGSGATGSHLEWKLTESNKIWNFMSYEFVINSIYRYLPNMFYSVHLIISTDAGLIKSGRFCFVSLMKLWIPQALFIVISCTYVLM